ncbi:MAG: leucyl aminopeptidase family protein [Bacteroidales bacterium]|nr:leucyl aminopeptidase family protein [Deltaproteobacteria bacterium]MBL7139185.1 leucyl aminopeptidase family protein [Bacteroidales bacterium]
MHPKIIAQTGLKAGDHLILLTESLKALPDGFFSGPEMKFIREQRKKKLEMIPFNRLDHWVLVQFVPEEKDADQRREKCRRAGDKIQLFLNEQKVARVTLFDVGSGEDETMALLEGMALGTYQFFKYKTDKEGVHTLRQISLFSEKIEKKALTAINALLDGVDFARNLVNEPNSYLTATTFAGEVESMAEKAGITVELLKKKKLEALQMGGLLGVNKGSHEPPVFIIMEYKPTRPKNKRPIVLVGKGIVYDTGGMNLKTESNMENMKTDMAGGAAVAGTMLAVARAKLPVHVVGLIPATDNWPGPRAIVSGDILRMHNGMTVEVINTDAEGRLILADALSYAKRYDPELTIDISTLTGSAIRAIGKRASAGMQSDASKEFNRLKECGSEVYERIVELPLWEDYGEDLKSETADIKNLGGPEAGAITAGKFLQKFTSYPYIHLDIAGPAFLDKRDSYRGQGGTGMGIRLLVKFLQGIKN